MYDAVGTGEDMSCLRIYVWFTIIITVCIYVAVMLPAALEDHILDPDQYSPETEKNIRVEYILSGLAVAAVGGLTVLLLFLRMMDR